MADNSAGVDLNKLVQDIAASKSTPTAATNMSVRSGGSSAPDIDALSKILAGATKSVALEAEKQKTIQATQRAVVEQQQVVSAGAAHTQEMAGGAAAEIAAQAGTASYKTQQENAALKGAAGLDPSDPNSVLRKSINDINLASDRRNALLVAAQQRNDVTFGDVLSGKTSFGSFFDAKVIDPAKNYTSRAATEEQIIANETSRISALQHLYTGQAQVNASAQQTLTESSAADAAMIAAARYSKDATELKLNGLVAGSRYLEQVMTQSQHSQADAISAAHLAVSVENSKHQWEMYGANMANKNPEDYARYVQMGAKFLGNAGAANYSPEFIKQYSNNPEAKAQLDNLAQIGVSLYGHAVTTLDQPTPNLLGTPGESVYTLEKNRGNLPRGMETVQGKLMDLSAGTEYQMINGIQGKALKPAERVSAINDKTAAWLDSVATNMDEDSVYGKPNIAVVAGMNSMQQPSTLRFTDKILKPLAASNPNVPIQMVIDATVNSDLPFNEQVAGLVAYGRSAAASIDATRRPQIVGLKRASNMGYTAVVATGSLFGNKRSVNFAQEKDVSDYLFLRQQYMNAKTRSLTLIDAAAASLIIGKEQQ